MVHFTSPESILLDDDDNEEELRAEQTPFEQASKERRLRSGKSRERSPGDRSRTPRQKRQPSSGKRWPVILSPTPREMVRSLSGEHLSGHGIARMPRSPTSEERRSQELSEASNEKAGDSTTRVISGTPKGDPAQEEADQSMGESLLQLSEQVGLFSTGLTDYRDEYLCNKHALSAS